MAFPKLLIFLGTLLFCTIGAEQQSSQVELAEQGLAAIADSLRNVSLGGDSEAFKLIGTFAKEAEAFLQAASRLKSDSERLALLEEGLARREVWLEALAMTHEGLQNPTDEAEANPGGNSGLEGLMQKVKDLQALQGGTVGDREALLAKLQAIQGEMATMEAQAVLAAGVGVADEVVDDEASAPWSEPAVAKQEEPAMSEEEVAQAGRLVQKATRDGHLDMIEGFLTKLQQNPAACAQILNWGDKVGATVLHWSVFTNSPSHLKILKIFLVQAGIDPRISDRQGRSPCHLACIKGHHLALRELLAFKGGNTCEPEAIGVGGESCVHVAAKRADVATLEVLREFDKLRKDTVNVPTGPDHEEPTATPLWLAVQGSSVPAVKILLAAGADANLGLTGDFDESVSPTSSKALAKQRKDAYAEILKGLDPRRGSADDIDSDGGRMAEL